MQEIDTRHLKDVLRRHFGFTQGTGGKTGHETWVNAQGRRIHPVMRKKAVPYAGLFASGARWRRKGSAAAQNSCVPLRPRSRIDLTNGVWQVFAVAASAGACHIINMLTLDNKAIITRIDDRFGGNLAAVSRAGRPVTLPTAVRSCDGCVRRRYPVPRTTC